MGEGLKGDIEQYIDQPEQEGSEQEKLDQYCTDAQQIVHDSPEWQEAKQFNKMVERVIVTKWDIGRKYETVSEEEEKQLAEVAQQYVADILHYGEPLPTRFAFSSTSGNTYREGFQNSSFIVDKDRSGFDYSMLNFTRNDALNHSPQIYERISGTSFTKYISEPELNECIEQVKNNYPDIYDTFIQKYQYLHNLIRAEKRRDGLSYEDAQFEEEMLDPYTRLQRLIIDIDKITEVVSKHSSPDQEKLIPNIIRNFLTEKPMADWPFEEQELWYESTISDFVLSDSSFVGMQYYDMAYLVDSHKITAEQDGYLSGIEKEITASPESIIGIVDNSWGRMLPRTYLINKMLKNYKANPQLARPIYDTQGDLLWPQPMLHEDIANKEKLPPLDKYQALD